MSQFAASQDIKTVRRYFVGTTVLRLGQILNYQEDATKTNADPKLRLGHAVEVINSSNAKYLAGVVPASEAGKTGPCYVELLQPQSGDVLDVEADGTTDIAAAAVIEPDATLGGLIAGTAAAGDNLFISFEAHAAVGLVAIRVQKV